MGLRNERGKLIAEGTVFVKLLRAGGTLPHAGNKNGGAQVGGAPARVDRALRRSDSVGEGEGALDGRIWRAQLRTESLDCARSPVHVLPDHIRRLSRKPSRRNPEHVPKWLKDQPRCSGRALMPAELRASQFYPRAGRRILCYLLTVTSKRKSVVFRPAIMWRCTGSSQTNLGSGKT